MVSEPGRIKRALHLVKAGEGRWVSIRRCQRPRSVTARPWQLEARQPGTRLERREEPQLRLETREPGSRGRGPTSCLGTEPGSVFRILRPAPGSPGRASVSRLATEPGSVFEPGSRVSDCLGASCYSAIASPEPPSSAGKSLSFGRPSFMGRTVEA